MKLEIEYWILVVLIFVAMAMAIMGGCNREIPYQMESTDLIQYPLEGYENSSKEGLTGVSVKGFEGHFNRPSENTANIDKISMAPGSKDSIKPSFGLTNTMGKLVLDDDMVKLLSSRGGNVTGQPDTI
jgi:hypothetical protein